MSITFLFDSAITAEEVAFQLRGDWDGCNCVELAVQDLDDIDLAAVKCAVDLVGGQYCLEWAFCPYLSSKLLNYPVGSIIKTTRFLQVGEFAQGSLGIIKKQYSQLELDAFDALAAANPDCFKKARPSDLYEITLVKYETTLFKTNDENYSTFRLSTKTLESKDFFLFEGDEALVAREVKVLTNNSPLCSRSLIVNCQYSYSFQ